MMKKRWTLGIILVAVGLLLGACGGTITQPTLTSTTTQHPTVTTMPTFTLPATPTEKVGRSNYYESPANGYSFELPEDVSSWFGFEEVELDSTRWTIVDIPHELFIHITAGKPYPTFNLDQEINFLAEIYSNREVEIDPETFEVDGHPARRAMISGEDGEGVNYISQYIYINAGFGRLIRINTYLYGEKIEGRWEEEVVPLLDVLVGSFRIFPAVYEVKDEDCPVSTDPTYGYSVDDPILLGGGSSSFEHRWDYLANLLGPNREYVEVTKLRSFAYNNYWLELYQLTYQDQDEPAFIYINTGLWSRIAAPMGFSCSEPFSKLEP